MRALFLVSTAIASISGCHSLPSDLDAYCHDDPMTAECPEGTCSGPYECIAYCIEHYPEHTGVPASGTGAWCDDLLVPTDYCRFCNGHPNVVGCTAWFEAHPGRCSNSSDSDADADGDGDGDGDADADADSDAAADGDGDEGETCGNDRCDDTESASTCERDCPPICGDRHVTHSEQCEPNQSESCVTSCDSTGTRQCEEVTCLWSEYCEPPPEACGDGVDNDCDDQIDEGCG